QRNLPTKVVNLYSVRVPADIIFEGEFHAMCQQNANFTFNVTCTRVSADDPSWNGLRGRINPDMIEQFSPDSTRAVYYVCGSHDFVAHESQMLRDMGFPKDRVIYEDWG